MKVVVLGDAAAGKTCMAIKFAFGKFFEDNLPDPTTGYVSDGGCPRALPATASLCR